MHAGFEFVALADAPFESNAKQLTGLDGKFHRQLLQNLFAKAVHDRRDGILDGQSSLLAIEDLIFANLGNGRFVQESIGLARGISSERFSAW